MFNLSQFKSPKHIVLLALFVMLCGGGLLSITSSVFAQTSSSSTQDGCEPGGAFYKAMEKAQQSDVARRLAAHSLSVNETTEQARQYRGKMGTPFGEVYYTLCLQTIENYQQLIMGLLGKAGAIYNMLVAFANQLLNLACQYVVAAINNVLNSICIPLPDLGLGLPGFGGPDRKSCNGISLADVMSVGVEAPRLPYYSSGEMRNIYDNAVKTMKFPTSRGTRQ